MDVDASAGAMEKWFAKSPAKEGLLDGANALLRDKRQWAILIINESAVVGTEKIDQLYRYTKDDVELQIASARSEMMHAAKQGKAWYTAREEDPTRRAGLAFQSSLTAFSRFLQNFSGLVEIAKAADQQYGGLAYGTLSLLLSVAARKSQHEETYLDSFEELSYAFPRLETLLQLDPYERLEMLIANTFANIVLFARQMARYYLSRRQRFKAALRSEGEEMRVLGDVRKGLSRIRDECDIFLLQQIHELRRDVREMGAQLKTTDARVHRTERHVLRQSDSADIAYLATLRNLLGITEMSPSTDLVRYGDFLRQQFSSENLHLKHRHPRATSMQLLESDSDFHQWWNTDTSRLLLAGGTNCSEDHSTGSLNWMSIGAVLAIEQLREADKDVAYFLAQTTHARRRYGLRDVMASLLYQLAEIHEHRLRSKLDRIQNLVNGPCWASKSDSGEEGLLDTIGDALLDIFLAFEPEDEINMVIDRLDQCDWGTSDSLEALDNMQEVLKMLLRVITHATCRVKVLVTVDSWFSRCFQNREVRSLSRKERAHLLVKADWVQQLDDDDFEV